MRAGDEAVCNCPLCGAPMYGWVAVPSAGKVPAPEELAAEATTVVDRCEDCGAGLVRDPAPVDLGAELEALVDPEREVLVAPNRASLQAGIGGGGWAALSE